MGNRYTPRLSGDSVHSRMGNDNTLTLIFLHAAGMFKECFEPTIDIFFSGYSSDVRKSPSIGEIWSIECPNHGQSAVLNADDISVYSPDTWQIHEYADAVYAYLQGRPGGYDLSKRDLVLVGHSMGGFVIPFLIQMEPKLKFNTIVLADPVISPRCRMMERIKKVYIQAALSRKDNWTSCAEAREYLDINKVLKIWTSGMKDLFIKHAIVPFKDSRPPHLEEMVTLACSKKHEISIYTTSADDDIAHVKLASLYSSKTPVHLLYERTPHPLIGTVQAVLHQCHGFKPTSAQPIRSGHMFFQMDPDEAATLILNALRFKKNHEEVHSVARL
ncbi:hypothetical protein SISSUDRAFT_1059016 [Sistotremastrum suecicum HHB10207 ss-3]|uniref:AB hydrolase-1 domain-containing protein n=1 Tax=Sistotremastrum suecicum HHB10207 ss-3 TaxID=1314776 RepID=A0A166GQ82_9AGAM|nr:hypothetical protein SISSUDRAFT_1059016 [Sistotremastrum suecicum HHB10207 ss-3]